MTPSARLRNVLLGTLLCAPLALAGAAAARAAQAVTVGDAAVLTIHDAGETLRDFCVEQQGTLWLVLPDGTRQELVTSIDDPAILNKGDGSFHPFDASQVVSALGALRAPLASIHAEVFLLPYPSRVTLGSAASPGLILLSPGVRSLAPEQQQAEFVHELGHVVHFARMPDGDVGWARYRELRGITDEAVYNASAPHANRPHEIFAEDFRALIGGPLATYSGTIENPTLAAPATVAGLDDFMRAVAAAGAALAPTRVTCFPNPSRGPVSFVLPGGESQTLEIYDPSGRRVAALAPTAGAGGVTWRWDGRDATGAPVGAGVFFARARAGQATLRLTRIR